MNGKDEYSLFVDKFKPKKTTDDCYTPENVYQAVCGWAIRKYGFQEKNVLRPFWPGADYQAIEYPPGSVVVDNPPFSIFTKIVRWYAERNVHFFLFAPGLTAMGTVAKINGVTLLATGSSIVYDNGAIVNTLFVTNLDDPCIVARAVPELTELLKKCNSRQDKKHIRKLTYPDAVLTGAAMNFLSNNKIEFSVRREESCYISVLDNSTKNIFGGGLLLSKSAAERAAAERAAAERSAEQIKLSARELEIQKILDGRAR